MAGEGAHEVECQACRTSKSVRSQVLGSQNALDHRLCSASGSGSCGLPCRRRVGILHRLGFLPLPGRSSWRRLGIMREPFFEVTIFPKDELQGLLHTVIDTRCAEKFSVPVEWDRRAVPQSVRKTFSLAFGDQVV